MKWSVLSLTVLLVSASGVGRAQDLDANYQSLRDAESKCDVENVKKLAPATAALAREAAKEGVPEAADEKEGWTKRIEYAKSVEDFCDYALYSVALKQTPAGMVDLMGALEAQNPKSKYLDQGYASYLYALSQAGQAAKIPAVAEKALANFPENPDLLAVLADQALSTRQSGKAQTYANRLIAAMGKAVKPQGVGEAEWERNKATRLGRAYWISGVVSGEANQYAAANRNLRAALPYIKGNDAMMASALFHLGVSNYQLGKMTMNKGQVLEGATFSEQCSKIQSQYADQAWKNAQLIKADAAKMR